MSISNSQLAALLGGNRRTSEAKTTRVPVQQEQAPRENRVVVESFGGGGGALSDSTFKAAQALQQLTNNVAPGVKRAVDKRDKQWTVDASMDYQTGTVDQDRVENQQSYRHTILELQMQAKWERKQSLIQKEFDQRFPDATADPAEMNAWMSERFENEFGDATPQQAIIIAPELAAFREDNLKIHAEEVAANARADVISDYIQVWGTDYSSDPKNFDYNEIYAGANETFNWMTGAEKQAEVLNILTTIAAQQGAPELLENLPEFFIDDKGQTVPTAAGGSSAQRDNVRAGISTARAEQDRLVKEAYEAKSNAQSGLANNAVADVKVRHKWGMPMKPHEKSALFKWAAKDSAGNQVLSDAQVTALLVADNIILEKNAAYVHPINWNNSGILERASSGLSNEEFQGAFEDTVHQRAVQLAKLAGLENPDPIHMMQSAIETGSAQGMIHSQIKKSLSARAEGANLRENILLVDYMRAENPLLLEQYTGDMFDFYETHNALQSMLGMSFDEATTHMENVDPNYVSEKLSSDDLETLEDVLSKYDLDDLSNKSDVSRNLIRSALSFQASSGGYMSREIAFETAASRIATGTVKLEFGVGDSIDQDLNEMRVPARHIFMNNVDAANEVIRGAAEGAAELNPDLDSSYFAIIPTSFSGKGQAFYMVVDTRQPGVPLVFGKNADGEPIVEFDMLNATEKETAERSAEFTAKETAATLRKAKARERIREENIDNFMVNPVFAIRFVKGDLKDKLREALSSGSEAQAIAYIKSNPELEEGLRAAYGSYYDQNLTNKKRHKESESQRLIDARDGLLAVANVVGDAKDRVGETLSETGFGAN